MKNVLIVEDYENIKYLYADAFKRAGYKVETAQSGEAGLEKTAEQEFDCIVLDMLMLRFSGTEFLEAFEPAEHPNTTVIVVSNLDSPATIKRALALGASNYLIKSQYTPKELVEAIQDIVLKKTKD